MNGMKAEADECPSHFALDDHQLHGGGPALRRHLDDCHRCQARIVERAAGQTSFSETSTALWTRIAARAQDRRHRRRHLLLFRLPALAVGLGAVALLLLARKGSDGPAASAPYLTPKGVTPVEITCRRGDATFRLAPGDDVLPGDRLRFRPLPIWPAARFIQIGSVDGTGRYTPFYPSAAGTASAALPAAGQALEGGIEIDAAPGPERLFVVLSADPLSETAVRRAAEPRAAPGTTVDEIDGAPVSTHWIVLGKRAGAAATP
jgi:hypothetical protein